MHRDSLFIQARICRYPINLYVLDFGIYHHTTVTVNSEIFREGFIFAYAKFGEYKILVKWRNHSVVY